MRNSVSSWKMWHLSTSSAGANIWIHHLPCVLLNKTFTFIIIAYVSMWEKGSYCGLHGWGWRMWRYLFKTTGMWDPRMRWKMPQREMRNCKIHNTWLHIESLNYILYFLNASVGKCEFSAAVAVWKRKSCLVTRSFIAKLSASESKIADVTPATAK